MNRNFKDVVLGICEELGPNEVWEYRDGELLIGDDLIVDLGLEELFESHSNPTGITNMESSIREGYIKYKLKLFTV